AADVDHLPPRGIRTAEGRVGRYGIEKRRLADEHRLGIDDVAEFLRALTERPARTLIGRAAAQVVETLLPLAVTGGIELPLADRADRAPSESDAHIGVGVASDDHAARVAGHDRFGVPLQRAERAGSVGEHRLREKLPGPVAAVEQRLIHA